MIYRFLHKPAKIHFFRYVAVLFAMICAHIFIYIYGIKKAYEGEPPYAW